MSTDNSNIQIDTNFHYTCCTLLELMEHIQRSYNIFVSTHKPDSVLYYPCGDDYKIQYTTNSFKIINTYGSVVLSIDHRKGERSFSFFDTDIIDINKNKPLLFGIEKLARGVYDDELLLYYDTTVDKFYLDNDGILYDDLDSLHFQLSTLHDIYNLKYIKDHIELFKKLNDSLETFNHLYINDFGLFTPNTYNIFYKGLL